MHCKFTIHSNILCISIAFHCTHIAAWLAIHSCINIMCIASYKFCQSKKYFSGPPTWSFLSGSDVNFLLTEVTLFNNYGI